MRLFTILKCLTFFLVFPLWGIPEEWMQEANASYQQGERATSFYEQKQAFNRALYLYSLAEQEMGPGIPTLDCALADTYYQLGEYAWAILYYQRALKANPHQDFVLSRLTKAQQKLGLSTETPASRLSSWIQFFLELSQHLGVFVWVLLVTFLFWSLTIWFPSSWMRKLAGSGTILLCFLIFNFLYFYYFTPLEGILVTSTGLYRGPSANQPQLTNYPLSAGSKVLVLEMTSEGNWAKIANTAGIIGYIPTTSLRLI
jgi:tetratricopeptide (TPR) repeat protein